MGRKKLSTQNKEWEIENSNNPANGTKAFIRLKLRKFSLKNKRTKTNKKKNKNIKRTIKDIKSECFEEKNKKFQKNNKKIKKNNEKDSRSKIAKTEIKKSSYPFTLVISQYYNEPQSNVNQTGTFVWPILNEGTWDNVCDTCNKSFISRGILYGHYRSQEHKDTCNYQKQIEKPAAVSEDIDEKTLDSPIVLDDSNSDFCENERIEQSHSQTTENANDANPNFVNIGTQICQEPKISKSFVEESPLNDSRTTLLQSNSHDLNSTNGQVKSPPITHDLTREYSGKVTKRKPTVPPLIKIKNLDNAAIAFSKIQKTSRTSSKMQTISCDLSHGKNMRANQAACFQKNKHLNDNGIEIATRKRYNSCLVPEKPVSNSFNFNPHDDCDEYRSHRKDARKAEYVSPYSYNSSCNQSFSENVRTNQFMPPNPYNDCSYSSYLIAMNLDILKRQGSSYQHHRDFYNNQHSYQAAMSNPSYQCPRSPTSLVHQERLSSSNFGSHHGKNIATSQPYLPQTYNYNVPFSENFEAKLTNTQLLSKVSTSFQQNYPPDPRLQSYQSSSKNQCTPPYAYDYKSSFDAAMELAVQKLQDPVLSSNLAHFQKRTESTYPPHKKNRVQNFQPEPYSNRNSCNEGSYNAYAVNTITLKHQNTFVPPNNHGYSSQCATQSYVPFHGNFYGLQDRTTPKKIVKKRKRKINNPTQQILYEPLFTIKVLEDKIEEEPQIKPHMPIINFETSDDVR